MLAVVVSGPAGAGKSTLAEALARRTGAVLLDLDTVTDGLLDRVFAATALPGHWNEDRHRDVVRPARYAALLDVAAEQARLGRDVVLSAPFTAELQGGAEWRAVRRALPSARLVVVWLHGPVEVLSRRLLDRGEPRDLAPSVGRSPWAPRVPHLPLDATVPTEEQVAVVLGACAAAGRAAVGQTEDVATDQRLRQVILDLLDARADGATICPSDAARAADPEGWRGLMEPVREAARGLVAERQVVITQGGEVVDPATASGPIRIRRVR